MITCVAKFLIQLSIFELNSESPHAALSSMQGNSSMASNVQCAAQGSMGPWYDAQNLYTIIVIFTRSNIYSHKCHFVCLALLL